jgi:hypothetical protein
MIFAIGSNKKNCPKWLVGFVIEKMDDCNHYYFFIQTIQMLRTDSVGFFSSIRNRFSEDQEKQ